MAIKLEICIEDETGLHAAIAGGADRIELCAALDVGGLSPSLALLQGARQSPVPVYVMVRPRAGDFQFSKTEIAAMCAEIHQVKELGLAGVVVGAGGAAGLDLAALRQFCDAAGGLGITLHRVVDLLPDRVEIQPHLSELGIERILTSGGAICALEGLEDIVRQVRAAPLGLSVMPGAGIRPDNLETILQKTNVHEIHASASSHKMQSDPQLSSLGFSSAGSRQTDTHVVRQLKLLCQRHAA